MSFAPLSRIHVEMVFNPICGSAGLIYNLSILLLPCYVTFHATGLHAELTQSTAEYNMSLFLEVGKRRACEALETVRKLFKQTALTT